MKSGGTVAGADAVALVAARSSSPKKALLVNMFPAATEVDLLISHMLKSGTVVGERATLVKKTPFHASHKEIDIVQITSSRFRVKFYGSGSTHWGRGPAGIVHAERGIETHCGCSGVRPE